MKPTRCQCFAMAAPATAETGLGDEPSVDVNVPMATTHSSEACVSTEFDATDRCEPNIIRRPSLWDQLVEIAPQASAFGVDAAAALVSQQIDEMDMQASSSLQSAAPPSEGAERVMSAPAMPGQQPRSPARRVSALKKSTILSC